MRIMFLSQSPRPANGEAEHERVQALLRSYASPGTELDLDYPDDFPGARVFVEMGDRTALSGLHHTMEAPALIRKAVWAEEHGYDALIQSNTFDPGVEASRLAVRIPVIGVQRASLHFAATLADRIAITVPLEGHVPHTWRIIRSYGLQNFVLDIRPVGVYGANLLERQDEIQQRAADLMKALIRDTGAEAILPLGGALIPYVVSPSALEKEVGVPVINSKLVGIRFAETCVAGGTTHSARTHPYAHVKYEDFTATQA